MCWWSTSWIINIVNSRRRNTVQASDYATEISTGDVVSGASLGCW